MSLPKKEISRNAGEWAEFYVLLNILSIGKLYAADGNLNKLEDRYFPVISIEMQKASNCKENPVTIVYLVDSMKKRITISSEGKSKQVDMATFKTQADDFFKIISTRKGKGTFSVPEISEILRELNYPVTKKSSSHKADIHIVIHDIMTGFENEVGFSIKSKHSSPATLINASGQTLFQYRITHPSNKLNQQKVIDALNPIKINKDGVSEKIGPKGRVKNLINSGYDLEFNRIRSIAFSENIQLIDSSLDVFLADCLYVFMKHKISSLSEIVEKVSKRNPCKYTTTTNDRLLCFYEYKMKRLVVDAALGMQPKTPWTGRYDASGGYIVVKEEGDVVCYHLYNWNALQDYLYKNLRFETPTSTGSGSKKSFNYALHYKENGIDYMDICLQLRFK